MAAAILRPFEVKVEMIQARCPRPIPWGTALVIKRYPDRQPHIIRIDQEEIELDKQGVELKPRSSFTVRLEAISLGRSVGNTTERNAGPGWARSAPAVPPHDGGLLPRNPPGGIGQ